jgi:hypothetical protein
MYGVTKAKSREKTSTGAARRGIKEKDEPDGKSFF